jgi:hypothetical protein
MKSTQLAETFQVSTAKRCSNRRRRKWQRGRGRGITAQRECATSSRREALVAERTGTRDQSRQPGGGSTGVFGAVGEGRVSPPAMAGVAIPARGDTRATPATLMPSASRRRRRGDRVDRVDRVDRRWDCGALERDNERVARNRESSNGTGGDCGHDGRLPGAASSLENSSRTSPQPHSLRRA